MLKTFTPALIALGAVLLVSGCGPLLRQKSFNESKEYFVSTPMADHAPDKGAAASWHIIKDPAAASPMLLDKLESDDPVDAGVAMVLLQAIAGNKYNQQLLAALESRDWSQAPGNLSAYIEMIEADIRDGRKGVVEERPVQ